MVKKFRLLAVVLWQRFAVLGQFWLTWNQDDMKHFGFKNRTMLYYYWPTPLVLFLQHRERSAKQSKTAILMPVAWMDTVSVPIWREMESTVENVMSI